MPWMNSTFALALTGMLFPAIVSAKTVLPTVQKLKVKEGFETTTPTGTMTRAWNSTVALRVDYYLPPEDPKKSSQLRLGTGIGSGSVVFKEERTDGIYLGILTAKHVANKDNTVMLAMSFDNIKELPIEVVAHDSSKNQDLSFIVVRVSSKHGQKIEPTPLPKKCSLQVGDPLAFVGFPATFTRPQEFQSVPIPESKHHQKRWSVGLYEGSRRFAEGQPVFGTTVDAISGSSGGPAINVAGEQVGVVSVAFLAGVVYAGDDNPFQLRPHSCIVGCDETKAFAETSWQKFLDFMGTTL